MHARASVDGRSGRRGHGRRASRSVAGSSLAISSFSRGSLAPLRRLLGEVLPPDILFGFQQSQADLSGFGAAHRSRPRYLVARLLAAMLDGDLADLGQTEQVHESCT